MVLLKVIHFLNPTSFRPVGDELSMFSRIFLQFFLANSRYFILEFN